MQRRWATGLAIVALALGGCHPAASASAQGDARDLLDRAVATFAALRTAHAHVELAGTFQLDLDGSGKVKAVDLAGATVDADVDLTNDRGKVAFAVPAYLDLGGDIVQIGPQRYVRTGVGAKYVRSIDPLPAPASVVGHLEDVVRTLQAAPVQGADEGCGTEQCSKISVTLDGVDLSGTGLPVAAATAGRTTIDLWVRQSDARPVKVAAVFDGGDAGKLWATITFSAFDVPVAVVAPPADEIQVTSVSPSAGP
ncbi:MAG TPA: hypothetical protein VF323_12845 [Candidatus Limnocylindrales bacterium]